MVIKLRIMNCRTQKEMIKEYRVLFLAITQGKKLTCRKAIERTQLK
jgi:hypothetical protein